MVQRNEAHFPRLDATSAVKTAREKGSAQALAPGRHRCSASAGACATGLLGLCPWALLLGLSPLARGPSAAGAGQPPRVRWALGRVRSIASWEEGLRLSLPKGQGRLQGQRAQGRTRRVPSGSCSRPECSPATRPPARTCRRGRLWFPVGSWRLLPRGQLTNTDLFPAPRHRTTNASQLLSDARPCGTRSGRTARAASVSVGHSHF